jgi:hypothetical protein
MRSIHRPTNERIEQLAANNPGLLNPLYAYFVMGWMSVKIGTSLVPHSGTDYDGIHRNVPDYVRFFGVESVVLSLFYSPEARGPAGECGLDLLIRYLP